MSLESAARLLGRFERTDLTGRLSGLERLFEGKDATEANALCEVEALDDQLFHAALRFKQVAGQINVVIHALGILLALPRILDPEEHVEYLSLGAGNTGRDFDLVTNRRIAEFKFIRWRGGPESIRQNSLFKDYFDLAEATDTRKRCLYVLGLEQPLAFLSGRRALRSVMSRNASLSQRFSTLYGSRFGVVREYYHFRKDRVELIDLLPMVPALSKLPEDSPPAV